MKYASFGTVCPVEIGDEIITAKKPIAMGKSEGSINLLLDGAVFHTITDIAVTNYVKTGKVEFTYELDNSGIYEKIFLSKIKG